MGQVQSYKRKITYFYQYHNGNVGATAGFLKLEIRGDRVKIIINIQEPPGLPYKEAALYFYHEAGDHLSAVKVGTVESMSGVLSYQTRTEWQQLFDTGRDLYTFDGVAVVYNDNHYYIGDFKDKDRRDYELIRKEPKKSEVAPASAEGSGRAEAVRYVEGSLGRESAAHGREAIAGEAKWENSVGNRTADVQKEGTVGNGTADVQNEESIGNKTANGQKAGDQEPPVSMPEKAVDTETAGEAKREHSVGNGTVDVQKEDSSKSETTDGQKAGSQKPPVSMPEKKTDMEAAGELAMEAPAGAPDKEDVFEKCENCPYQKKRMAQLDDLDAFEKMIAEYPKLPMYGATELFQCVRIHPKDIGKLDMRNWKLGVNSFLTHGYYTYQYLLLGKMRFDDGSARPIIGVPGVFSNREKYLANMFGFEQFIPVKKVGVKTGEFGYWIVEISTGLR